MAQVNRSPSYDNMVVVDELGLGDATATEQDSEAPLSTSEEESVRRRPTPLHLSNDEIQSEMIAPTSPPPSRFKSKWSSIFSSSDRNASKNPPKHSRKVRIFYKRQRKDIEVLKEARKMSLANSDDKIEERYGLTEWEESDGERKRQCCGAKSYQCIKLSVGTAARLTFAVNLFLLFAKLSATIQSGSLSVLSSLIDSVLDLFSGVAIGVSSYLIKRYDRFHYPIGRNRLESVAIIITACVMGTAALQIVTKAIEDITGSTTTPNINAFSGSIIGVTVILKAGLYILCRQVNNPSVRALAVDHRNDVASNIATLLFGLLGTYVHRVIDPVGAILLSFYIIINWVFVGYEQVKNLVGHTADRRFISKLTWIAANHDSRIESVDTVRAYTFGVNYLVEVDIQLPAEMPLSTAHDIGEALQLKLESLDEVERAFVHLDFETMHSPSTEHKYPT